MTSVAVDRAINTERPWAHLVLVLYLLTLTQAGDESTRVVLRGVTRPTVDLVLGRVEAALPAGHAPAPAGAEQSDRTIYAASVPELVLMSFVYGQVVVLAAAVAATLWDLLEEAGLLESLGFAAGRLPVWAQVLGAIAVGLLIGVCATLVRYFRFRVGVNDRSRLSIRFGLLEPHERRIDPAAVEGLVLHRNLVEQWSGRARLALLTTDSAAQLRSNLLLPSLPVDVVRSIAEEYFADLVPADSLLDHRPRRVRAVLVSLGALGVAAGAGLALHRWTGLPVWAALLAGLTVLLAALVLGTSWTTGSQRGRPQPTHARPGSRPNADNPAHASGSARSHRQLARPGPRFLWVALGAYAGRPLHWFALGHPRAAVDDLARQIRSGLGTDGHRAQPWGFTR